MSIFGKMISASNSETTIEAKQRCVGCFDILGFRNALKTVGAKNLAELYHNAISDTNQQKADILQLHQANGEVRTASKFTNIEHIAFFSDSIFVFTTDTSDSSCVKIAEFANTIFQIFFLAGLPLRGGISCGETIIMPTKGLFLGEGIVQAYELEQSLDIIGIVMDDNVPALSNNETTRRLDISLKCGHKSNLRVPRLGWEPTIRPIARDAEIFKNLRMAGGEQLAGRYKKSETIVSIMLNRDLHEFQSLL